MLKHATYKEKFILLNDWLPTLMESIKKDLKNDHLKQDPLFMKKFFLGKNFNKLTTEELVSGYSQAIGEGMESLGDFIANRWLLRNGEIYHFFEEQLSKIDPNFTELEELDRHKSLELMEASIRQFGAPKTYLFSVLNSVVFPKEVYHQLGEKAKNKLYEQEKEEKLSQEKHSLDEMQRNHEREIARLTDKYEKKLAGLQKKYIVDVDSLKKQMSSLQRKLQGAS